MKNSQNQKNSTIDMGEYFKEFIPTDEQREYVRLQAIAGTPQLIIAESILNFQTKKHIDVKTLRKVFRKELDHGTEQMATKAVGVLAKAMQGDNPRAAISAAIFFLKSRKGWSEKVQVEHSGSVDVKQEADDAKSKLFKIAGSESDKPVDKLIN